MTGKDVSSLRLVHRLLSIAPARLVILGQPLVPLSPSLSRTKLNVCDWVGREKWLLLLLEVHEVGLLHKVSWRSLLTSASRVRTLPKNYYFEKSVFLFDSFAIFFLFLLSIRWNDVHFFKKQLLVNFDHAFDVLDFDGNQWLSNEAVGVPLVFVITELVFVDLTSPNDELFGNVTIVVRRLELKEIWFVQRRGSEFWVFKALWYRWHYVSLVHLLLLYWPLLVFLLFLRTLATLTSIFFCMSALLLVQKLL